jgi:hypothetical protein
MVRLSVDRRDWPDAASSPLPLPLPGHIDGDDAGAAGALSVDARTLTRQPEIGSRTSSKEVRSRTY